MLNQIIKNKMMHLFNKSDSFAQIENISYRKKLKTIYKRIKFDN